MCIIIIVSINNIHFFYFVLVMLRYAHAREYRGGAANWVGLLVFARCSSEYSYSVPLPLNLQKGGFDLQVKV